MTARRLPLVALTALVVAGCGGGSSGRETTVTTPTTSGTTTVAAYFLRDERVAPVQVRVPRTPTVAAAALRALLDETPGYGLTTAIPEGTLLNSVHVDPNGTATVDLSSEFGSGGGSASMLGRLAQVVYTVTQFPTVKQVLFELDGRPVTSLGGEGVVLEKPQTRADYEGQTPIILVESPTPGEPVASPLRVRGTANVFEATLQLRLVANGRKLYEHFVMATSGSGERGTFSWEIPFDATGPATLEAFEYSAADGSEIHKVRIPITLA